MRIIFDTNVIIAAIITRGSSFEVIKDSIYKHEILYTEYILKEIKEKVTTKFQLSKKTTKNIVSLIEKNFTRGKTAKTINKICRDPDDNQILADAAFNKVEVLITGDKDLLIFKKYKNTEIISPGSYWKL